LLDIHGLEAGYGKIAVLHGVDMTIGAGEVVTLLGPNGAGKTTLLRAISGLVPWNAGGVTFAGLNLAGIGPRETARRGLAHVIEGHRIFTNQTVTDNLLLAGYDVPRAERDARVDEALSYFPEIAAKRLRSRLDLERRATADACGCARTGAAAKTLNAGRAVGRPFASARRSRAGRRDKIAENRHGSVTRGATNREGVGCGGSSLCARPGENCTSGLDG
jgi:ABC-type branched-chain amino acid transport systems, ATPase component